MRRDFPDGLPESVALVLSGGIALGAYQAGVYQALDAAGIAPTWVVGASTGAINGAIIAGNPPDRRLERLRRFWALASQPANPSALMPMGLPSRSGSAASLALVSGFGCPPLFVRNPMAWLSTWPRLDERPGLFDLAPLRVTLAECVDFERLNSGEVRFTVQATDLESGEPVLFDTTQRRVEVDHLLASSAFLPDFRPVVIDGRTLGDGGLCANLPIGIVLDDHSGTEMLCIAVDLFARRGPRPQSIAAAVDRRQSLLLSSQSHQVLEAHRRIDVLRRRLTQLAARIPAEFRTMPEVAEALAETRISAVTVLHLTHRPENAGLGLAMYDFSPGVLKERWDTGVVNMEAGLRLIGDLGPILRQPGLRIHAIGPAEA